MIRVVVVGEGVSEEGFTKQLLAPWFWDLGISLEARLIPTSKHGRGGALEPQRVIRYLRNTLRESSSAYVTTFFDLYGLKPSFPGVEDSNGISDPLERATVVESAFHERVVAAADCRENRFFPHIQPYEFEALLFSGCSEIAALTPEWRRYEVALERIRDAHASPEHINDGPTTHPSVRLRAMLSPRYEKVLHGLDAAKRIGLEAIRAECRHFHRWMSHIESLSPGGKDDR